jgi:prepilin-type processing-associated H-X9-DG protein
MLYTQDHSETLPPYQFITDSSPGGFKCRLYRPYIRSYDILRCPGAPYRSARLGRIARPGYAYNELCLCAPLDKMRRKQGLANSDVYQLYQKDCAPFPKWPGRRLANVANPRYVAAFFCSEAFQGCEWNGENYGYGWEPGDITNGGRMINPHNGGANYAFLDGHVIWSLPEGSGFFMRTDGIDYDGNGTVGTARFMR